MWQCIYRCNFIQNYDKRIVFQIEKKKIEKKSFLDIFTISPLQRPREISQNISGLYYVGRAAGYKIHICAKLYYLGRAKVFSSVATDFGSWTITGINILGKMQFSIISGHTVLLSIIYDMCDGRSLSWA